MSQVVGKNKTGPQNWATVKEYIRNRARIVHIKDGEILWCAVGENIGVEINGKNSNYERPVLVFRKISKQGFIGVPLTSQKKEGDWFVHFRHHDKDQYAAITQVRFMSIHRVYRRKGQIDDADYERIAKGLHNILFPNAQNISNLTAGGLGRENPDYVTSITNQDAAVNSKNASNLAVGVCGRENPEYDSIIPNRPNLVKRLFQKIFRKTDRKNRKENQSSKGATNEP